MTFTELNKKEEVVSVISKGESKRSRQTRTEQEAWVERWKKSGLSQARFCELHGIHPKTFSHWSKRVEENALIRGY